MEDTRVAEALDWLDKRSRPSIRKGMARYAIPADKALGVRKRLRRRGAKPSQRVAA